MFRERNRGQLAEFGEAPVDEPNPGRAALDLRFRLRISKTNQMDDRDLAGVYIVAISMWTVSPSRG